TDLAVASPGGNSVNVFGTGNGSFGAFVSLPVGNAPTSVAMADFNGDGALDLVAGNSADNSVSVILGNGSGSFAGAVNYNVGTGPAGLAVGNFNGDTK